jgi:hypothetical protein
MVERAAATVRERLERCLKAADKGRAIREEFPAAGGDPAELFRVEGKFNDKLLEEMIEQLKGNQYRFQPQVRTVVPQADVGLG